MTPITRATRAQGALWHGARGWIGRCVMIGFAVSILLVGFGMPHVVGEKGTVPLLLLYLWCVYAMLVKFAESAPPQGKQIDRSEV
jgi:purine-cytosine permease-like protein